MIRTFGAFKLTQTPLNYQFNVIKVGTLMTLITSMQEENHKLSKSEGAQKNLKVALALQVRSSLKIRSSE